MNTSEVQKLQESRDVRGLIEALGDSAVGWSAVGALGHLGEPAVEPLIEALKDKDRDATARRLAGAALGKVGAPATEALIEALTDTDEIVRRWAADALIHIEDARAVEPLIQALKDESVGVRIPSAEALTPLSLEPWSRGGCAVWWSTESALRARRIWVVEALIVVAAKGTGSEAT